MPYTPLQQLLEAYLPTAPQEETYKKAMLAFLQHPDCFKRSHLAGHFTASAWVLSTTQDRALLLLHAKLHEWMQPGGHCDGDPDVLQVAIKETQEESGLKDIIPVSDQIFDIDIHTIPAHGDVPAHQHYDIRFLLQVAPKGSDKLVGNHESKALRWFPPQPEVLPTQSPSVMRMFNKWCERLKKEKIPLI